MGEIKPQAYGKLCARCKRVFYVLDYREEEFFYLKTKAKAMNSDFCLDCARELWPSQFVHDNLISRDVEK